MQRQTETLPASGHGGSWPPDPGLHRLGQCRADPALGDGFELPGGLAAEQHRHPGDRVSPGWPPAHRVDVLILFLEPEAAPLFSAAKLRLGSS